MANVQIIDIQRIKCRIRELEIGLKNLELQRTAYKNELQGWCDFLEEQKTELKED